jgi:hypothetical protein
MMQEDKKIESKDLWVHIGRTGAIEHIWAKKPTLKEMQEAVDGYIEYVPRNAMKGDKVLPVPVNAYNDTAMRSGSSSLCEVREIIVNEEGLLRSDFHTNAVASFAAFGTTVREQDLDDGERIVGPSIVRVRHTPQDKQITSDEFMQLVGGVREGMWLFGLKHFVDEATGHGEPMMGVEEE